MYLIVFRGYSIVVTVSSLLTVLSTWSAVETILVKSIISGTVHKKLVIRLSIQ